MIIINTRHAYLDIELDIHNKFRITFTENNIRKNLVLSNLHDEILFNILLDNWKLKDYTSDNNSVIYIDIHGFGLFLFDELKKRGIQCLSLDIEKVINLDDLYKNGFV